MAGAPAPADPAFRHPLPAEIRALLDADQALSRLWSGLTELQRNEWICWTISAKQEATRAKRRARLARDIKGGTRTPCCWPGCPHRRAASRAFVEP